MQKVVKFMEKNVEWLVVGIAGLWVLYVVWFYFVTPPVMATIDGKSFTPGAVDEVILKVTQETLEPKTVPGVVPPFEVPSFSEQFLAQMGPKPVQPLPLSIVNLGSIPQKSTLVPGGGIDGGILKVDVLAQVPVPQIGTPVADRDQVVMKVDQKNPNVPLPPNVPTPVGVLPMESRADKYWVTIPAKFDETKLEESFVKTNHDKSLRRRMYLSVELEREEVTGVDAQGNLVWGNPRKVPPLAQFRPPVEKAQDLRAYADWALRPENQPIILQPPFYQTVTKPWQPPVKGEMAEGDAVDGMRLENQMATLVAQAKDGASAYNAMKSLQPADQARFRLQLTPKLRGDLYAHEQEILQREREAKKPVVPPPTRRPRSSGNNAPLKSASLYGLFTQIGPTNSDLPGYAPGSNNPYLASGSEGSSQLLNASQFQGAQTTPPKVLPIWAHDETVEPGKIYRYRMRVTIRNPVFDTRNVTSDPKLAQIPELPPQDQPDQGWSAWTEAVRIPTRVDFFVQGTTPGQAPQVKFNIYRWQNGKYNLVTTPNLQPGDMIGSSSSAGAGPVDFTTGWSVVDVRPASGNDVRVLVMDTQGRTETRYMKVDQTNPRQRELSFELQKAAQAVAPPNR